MADKILGVEEQNRLSMRARFRLAIAQNTGARGLELIPRRNDILDLVADVVHPALRVLFEELRNRRVCSQRL